MLRTFPFLCIHVHYTYARVSYLDMYYMNSHFKTHLYLIVTTNGVTGCACALCQSNITPSLPYSCPGLAS